MAKYNVEKVSLFNKPCRGGAWYSWTERCDRCERIIQDKAFMTSKKPDVNEVDFCVDCIRYFMDNNIPYEESKQQYGKNKKCRKEGR